MHLIKYLSTDKEEIEKALITEYKAKYRLAEASPFLKEPLISDLGYAWKTGQ